MRRRLVVSLLVPLAAGLATLSCLTTKNFKEPAGPRYEGTYARAAGQDESAQAPPLRVVTFNIEYGKQMDRALALLRTSEPLRAPDVLLLQEMDSAGVERVGRELGLNYLYYPSAIHPMSGREFGTAILSPWPLDEYEKIPLPHAAFGTRVVRSVTSAVVHRGALRVRVYAVHLPSPLAVSYDEREEQVRVITADAARTSDPVIIGGDFNGRKVGPWFRDAGFLWLTDKLPGTSRGLGHWWSFDHVFARGFRPVANAVSAGVVDPAGASDHRVVWVLLEPAPVAGAGPGGDAATPQKRREKTSALEPAASPLVSFPAPATCCVPRIAAVAEM